MSSDAEVCRAFRNTGKCKFGEDCKYAHTTGEPIAAPPRGECFNLRDSGECKFGDRCRFLHGTNDPRFDENGQRVKKAKQPRGEGKKKKRARKPRDPDAPVEKIDEVCNNYTEGKCRYGDRCRRIHNGDIEQVNVTKRRRKKKKPAQAGGEGDAAPTETKTKEKKERKKREPRVRRDPDAPREKIDEECNNYAAGKCRYGDNCRRQHVGDVVQAPVEKLDEVCNNFQSGRCRFGEMCRRQHTAPATE
jgi:hypothetical protein